MIILNWWKKKYFCFLIISLLLWCKVYAQQIDCPQLGKQLEADSVLAQFKNKYTPKDSINVDSILSKALFNKSQAIVEQAKHIDIRLNTFYANQLLNTFVEEPTVYTNINLSKELNMGALPIRLNGNVIMRGNQIDRRLSSLSFDLDHQSLVENLKKKAVDKQIKRSFDNLPCDEKGAFNELINLEAYRSIAYSDSINQYRRSAKDSILHHYSTAGGKLRDTAKIKEIKAEMARIDSLRQKVDSLRESYIAQKDKVENSLQKIRQEATLTALNFRQELENRGRGALDDKVGGKKTRALSFLSKIRKLSLGSHRFNSSDFISSGVPINGLAMEYEGRGWFAGGNWGVEGKRNIGIPSRVKNFRLLGENRKVFHAKAGLGDLNKNFLAVSVTRMKADTSSANTYASTLTAPKTNAIFHVESNWYLDDNFHLHCEGALSGSDYTGNEPQSDLLAGLFSSPSLSNAATNTSIRFNRKGTSAELGYETVGAEYNSLGNLFLLKNRNSISAKIGQSFWKNRLKAKLQFTQDVSADPSLISNYRQRRFSGELQGRLDKQGSMILVNYSPNTFLFNPGATDQSLYNANLITATGIFVYSNKKRVIQSTMLNLSNFLNESFYGDTTTTLNLYYATLNHTVGFGKHDISLTANAGVDQEDLGNLSDFRSNIAYGLAFKNGLKLSQGISFLKRYYDGNLFGGGQFAISYTLKKALDIQLNTLLLRSLETVQEQQISFNLSLLVRL